MAASNVSLSTSPKCTVRPLVIDFEAKFEEANSGIFHNKKIRDYAIQALGELRDLSAQITAEVEFYNTGNSSYRDPIVEKIEQIKREIIAPDRFPKVFDRGQLTTLKAFFAPIHQECEELQDALFQEETAFEAGKVRLNEAKGQQLSLLLSHEQQNFTNSKTVFGSFLERLASEVAQGNKTPTVYFAYAWPVEERVQQESFVQPFLRTLQTHLKMAGVRSAYLDITTNRYGANIYEYMQKTQSSDYVLIFGTPSLKKKHDTGLSAVCTELIHILLKRQEDLKGEESLRRVFPILLSGSHRESFPPEFERYITVRDWRQGGYLEHFQYLYLELFALPPGNYLEATQQFWNEALQGGPKELSKMMEESMAWYAERRQEVQKCISVEEVYSISDSQPMPVLSTSMAQLTVQAAPMRAARAAGVTEECKQSFSILAKVARKIDEWAPFVCQVSRNQDSHVGGTGFLIAPGILMTCSHVIPDPETAKKSHVVFQVASEKRRVDLDPDAFFINSSSPGNQKIPHTSTMDYTVVALQTKDLPPEVQSASQEARSIFQDGVTGPAMRDLEGVSMIHYPTQKGKAKEKMIGYGSLEVTWRDALNLCHLVPTKVGSSGAPLFNEEGQLLGMHRGEQGSIVEGGVGYGTVVPIEQIVEDLKTRAHQEAIEAFTRRGSEAITDQVQKVGGLIQQDLYAPVVMSEANRLHQMLQQFVGENIQPSPTLMQKLKEPLRQLDAILREAAESQELKMILSQSYHLLLEVLWYQKWYQLEQPMDKEGQGQVLAQAEYQLSQLPGEVRFQDGKLISTVDTRFYLRSMQEAAQCLDVEEGAWQTYLSQFQSPKSFNQVYTSLRASIQGMPLADWYVETWRLGWVSLQITTLEGFEQAIALEVPAYLEKGKEYTISLAMAYMTIINNPQATQSLKDRVFHGTETYPGLTRLIELEHQGGWLDLLTHREEIWNAIIGQADRFGETRYLAMEYLLRLVHQPPSSPYQEKSLSILLGRFERLKESPRTRFEEEKVTYSRRLGEIDQECEAIVKEREPLEGKWFYLNKKTRSSAEDTELATLQTEIETLESAEAAKEEEKKKVERALNQIEGLTAKQEKEKQILQEIEQFLLAKGE